MDLSLTSQHLVSQAEEILEELNLLKNLNRVGKPEIIGSMALDLMVRKDIDIEVCLDSISKDSIIKIVSTLILQDLRRMDFSFIDNTDSVKKDLPQGFYLGLKYHSGKEWSGSFSGNKEVWQIDVWFVTAENRAGSLRTQEIKQQLTRQKKDSILKIKSDLCMNENFKKTFHSWDIYKAVIENNVKDTAGFEEYLKLGNR